MTDITELALLASKAKASVFTLEYISQFEPADIDSDDVDLRFEVDGRDTGTNVSIVDECGQAAKVICTLVEALEKAQQRNGELETYSKTAIEFREAARDENRHLKLELEIAEKRIAELESRTVTVGNLQESAYRAGLTAGWNLGLANNNDGFNKCLAAHTAGIKVEAE
ncbi:ead/Ea22-like family protein [Klebsiella pneumoniae]|uniref:ead/Ea22-like family protein n=1 Tax=Klebsiella pneumoniae TaxID=573 RepID=UPI00330C85BA|nr:ead/Ea22-like family protein [Klebsiella pneumoniae]